VTFRKKLFFLRRGDTSPWPSMEDHPLSAFCDCLFNIFAGTLHPQPEGGPCRGDRDLTSKHHPIKTYVELEIEFHAFLTLEDGGEWSASRPSCLIPEERVTNTYCTGGWVVIRACLEAVAEIMKE
jgi:hypothetical protein